MECTVIRNFHRLGSHMAQYGRPTTQGEHLVPRIHRLRRFACPPATACLLLILPLSASKAAAASTGSGDHGEAEHASSGPAPAAASPGEHPPEAASGDHKAESGKKAKSGKPAADSAGKKKGESGKPAAAPPPVLSGAERKTYYIHDWIPFPKVTGKDVLSGQAVSRAPVRGRGTVVFFMSSWCIPCQKITPRLQELMGKYDSGQLQFNFVFAHDADSDALGFAEEYKVQEGILADHDLLAAFKNPPLPSIYVGDRNNWLVNRWEDPSENDLEKLKKMLDLMTVF